MTEEKRSFCRFCGTSCALLVTTDGERILSVRGDPADPVTRGYICAKGAALGHFHHHPDRLDTPLVRQGEQLVEAEWPMVLDDISGKLRDIIDRYGPDAVGGYGGTPAALCASLNVWRAFMSALGTSSVYSTVSVDVACAPLVAERVTGNSSVISQPDEDARMVILIGTNLVVSHGQAYFPPAPKSLLRRWAEQGELWVVDPRRSQSAEAATRHLALWPGSEFALLGHAVRSLLRDGADHDFLARFVDGVAPLREAVERFTLAETVAQTRLTAQEIADFVAAIRRAGRIAIHSGTGLSMGRNANVATLLMWALHAVTGSLDRRGGAYFNPGVVRNLSQNGWEKIDTSGPGPKSRPDIPARMGEYPCAALADEIEAGNLRALFVFAGNPVTALPNTGRLVRALKKLDLLVMFDVVSTATTQVATHVLPSTGQLEMSDLTLWDFMNPAEYCRYVPRVVEPQGARKPLWWALRELAQRLSLDVGIAAAARHDDDILRPMMDAAAIGFDALRSGPGTWTTQERTFGWTQARLPGGRWNLDVTDILAQFASAEAPQGAFVLIPHRQKNKMNSQMSDGTANPRRPDPACIFLNPDDAEQMGIGDGDKLRVSTAAGALEAPARVDARLRAGVVSVPHGFGDCNANQLTDEAFADPVSGMVQLSGLPVALAKV